MRSGSSQAPKESGRPIQKERPKAHRAWNDALLYKKVMLLVSLAIVGGYLTGMIEAHMGYKFWPMCVGLTVLAGVLVGLCKHWICLPFEELLGRLKRLDHKQRFHAERLLPVDREDEVGQFSRWAGEFAERCYQDYREAKHLRRTLDHGVEQATRKATHQLRRMAMHDPMTGLGNRRFIDENLEPLFQSAWASGTELICIAIDMDNFKAVNDTLGHAAGDKLLIFLAEIITGSKRHEDYGIRLGGDEFMVLMPGCGLDRAREYGENLISLFRQRACTLSGSEGVRADLSVGIASLQDGVSTGGQLMAAADNRLYTAKQSGKGRVVDADLACLPASSV